MTARALALCAILGLSLARAGAAEPRWLELRSLHTGESLTVRWGTDGKLDADALAGLRHLLRDHRNGAERDMDAPLFDLLADLAAEAKVEPRYQVISGYRSPATNATLHARSSAVSEKSLHMQGRAIDVRLGGVNTLRLATLARGLRRGGVGYYRGDGFVHVDTGRVRTWEQ
jgi:uncharacterized protein YcbK (DUF882 family)